MAPEKPRSAAVKLSELVDAVEFVSASSFVEGRAYICRKTGRIFWVSEDVKDEDAPDDIEDSDQYEEAPNRRDLDLGRSLPFAFARAELPGSLNEVRDMFGRKGAYARFKQLLHGTGMLNKWYAFEQSALEEALRDWCEAAGVPLIDN